MFTKNININLTCWFYNSIFVHKLEKTEMPTGTDEREKGLLGQMIKHPDEPHFIKDSGDKIIDMSMQQAEHMKYLHYAGNAVRTILARPRQKGLSHKQREVLTRIKSAVGCDTDAKHCWDWVEEIYRDTGAKRIQLMNTVPYYASKEYETINGTSLPKRVPDCGQHNIASYLVTYYTEILGMEPMKANERARLDYINGIQPGDHIFYNNQNARDRNGNHSCIFIKWLDEQNCIAQVASYWGKNEKGDKILPKIHRIDLGKCPVTYIAKPA